MCEEVLAKLQNDYTEAPEQLQPWAIGNNVNDHLSICSMRIIEKMLKLNYPTKTLRKLMQ